MHWNIFGVAVIKIYYIRYVSISMLSDHGVDQKMSKNNFQKSIIIYIHSVDKIYDQIL